MKGRLLDLVPRPDIPRPSRPEVPGIVRAYGTIGAVALLMTLGAAGVLSGAGIFVLAMIWMDAIAVIGSSVLMTFSLAVFLACYMWLTV